MTQLSKNNTIILFDLDYTLFDTDTFKKSGLTNFSLYPEIEKVLNELSSKATLGIFSEGETKFQKNKIRKTALKKYFLPKNIHIAPQKSLIFAKVFKKYQNKNLFIVDDKLTILHLAEDVCPGIKTIWVKRGKYAQNQEPIKDFTPDVMISNLEKLKKLAV